MFPIDLDKGKDEMMAGAVRVLLREMEDTWENDPCPPVHRITECELLMALGMHSSKINGDINGLSEADPIELLKRDSGVHQFWQHYRWRKGGRYVYAPSANLVRAFLATDIPINRSEISFPKETFYLSIPDEVDLTVWNRVTGEHQLDGFYVSLSEGYIYVCAVGRAHPGKPLSDNALASYCFPAQDDIKIEDWLDQERASMNAKRIMGENEIRTIEWLKIIHCAALYIEHYPFGVVPDPLFGIPEKKIARSQKIKSKKQRAEFLSKYALDVRYVRLGRSGESTHGSAMDSSSKLDKRVLVRGHWRRQPCGPRNTERKIIWVEPFFRGPEDGPVSEPRDSATVMTF